MKKQRLTKKLRIVTLWLVSVFWLTACQSDEETQHDRWDVSVKHALETLINEEGGKGAYAVFDFDKTTSVNDVSQALWVYQIEHLRFADAPTHLFLDGITEPDVVLDGLGLTSTQMGTVLKEEYDQLQALREAGWSLDEIHATDVYLDFRARMYSFLEGLADSFPSEVHLAWMPGLLTGYTLDEARAVVADAIDDQYGEGMPGYDVWISPDGRWGGNVERGIWISDEMRWLYRRLIDSGITPYVCSASHELIVEVLACDSRRGLGIPAEQVFGLRTLPGAVFNATYDTTYAMPINEGKVRCINAYMAPAHDGRAPVLVAGDSNGDVPMLTHYNDTRISLIIDVKRAADSEIGRLVNRARSGDSRYKLQPCFVEVPTPSGGGI